MEDTRWMELCPRFHYCSVNKCPLDPLFKRRAILRGDPEGTCKALIRDREAIAIQATAKGVMLATYTDAEKGLSEAEKREKDEKQIARAEASAERLRKMREK